jgi:DNA-binding NarL/FixJ family response regulator
VEEPERALELWQGLVQGRWTLVDTVDTDGKRFVLARRNAPRPRAFDKLDAEERCVLSYAAFGHSNKDMAYELGCSMNAVSATLSRGLRKLGLRSRTELAVVFGAQLFPPRSSKSG